MLLWSLNSFVSSALWTLRIADASLFDFAETEFVFRWNDFAETGLIAVHLCMLCKYNQE